MHILHISKYYFPYLGGVEGICKYLVERMPKHITSVVCFNNQRENAVDEINLFMPIFFWMIIRISIDR